MLVPLTMLYAVYQGGGESVTIRPGHFDLVRGTTQPMFWFYSSLPIEGLLKYLTAVCDTSNSLIELNGNEITATGINLRVFDAFNSVTSKLTTVVSLFSI